MGRPDLVVKYREKAKRLGLLEEEQVWPVNQPRRVRVVQSHAVYAAMVEQLPEKVRSMRERLHAWYAEVGAKFLEPGPGGPDPWRP